MPVEPVNLKRNLILPKANENYKSTIENQMRQLQSRQQGINEATEEKKCCYLRERERGNSLGILGFLFFKVIKLRNNNYSLFIRSNFLKNDYTL